MIPVNDELSSIVLEVVEPHIKKKQNKTKKKHNTTNSGFLLSGSAKSLYLCATMNVSFSARFTGQPANVADSALLTLKPTT